MSEKTNKYYLVSERKQDFLSRSGKMKILTTESHLIFLGLKFLSDTKIGKKDSFRWGTVQEKETG